MAIDELLRMMVLPMVDDPGFLRVDRTDHFTPDHKPTYILLTLRAAPGDVSKVIGKGGRVARSLRTVLGGAARKLGVRIDLNIVNAGS